MLRLWLALLVTVHVQCSDACTVGLRVFRKVGLDEAEAALQAASRVLPRQAQRPA
jgi:hypothetical protein